MRLVVSKDLEGSCERAAKDFVRIAEEAIHLRGRCVTALSGGSTPKVLYRKLVKADLAWDSILFFFGDERNVTRDDERSNYRLAEVELFEPLAINNRVFRWQTELDAPEKVAADYEQKLKSVFPNGDLPRFDIVLLGLGTDGHIASLFPDTAALTEKDRAAVANWVPQIGEWRYTLTLPVFNNARNIVFIVAGSEKAAALGETLADETRSGLPARMVKPLDGEVFWFADKAAAGGLSR